MQMPAWQVSVLGLQDLRQETRAWQNLGDGVAVRSAIAVSVGLSRRGLRRRDWRGESPEPWITS